MRLLSFLLVTTFAFAQQTSKVDFINCDASVAPDFDLKQVVGSVNYHFKVLSAIDTIRIDARDMNFDKVRINGKSVRFKNNKRELLLFEGYKKGINTVTASYQAKPRQTMYFTGQGTGSQIWTQGQGKFTSYWLPSFDDVNEKVVFNLKVYFDENFVVISNGVLKQVLPIKEVGQKAWIYEMEKPMSSYLVALAIGDFRNKVLASKSHIPLQLFIQPKDTARFEPTYRYSKQIFDYLEKEIGYAYPWQIYKQVPVEDFLYGGMENTTCTLFTQDFVVDEIGFNDRNYVNVNAHELAHQWFGDLVTAKSGKHHWLQEGFATYYALLSEREVFGDDYFYHMLYRNSLLLRNAAKTDTIPVMSDRASSLSYYQKGAWALHFMRESIGAKKFQKAIKNYLKKYQFQNVETRQFLAEVSKAAPGFDTAAFQKNWLEDYHFPTDVANDLLKKSNFMKTLFEVQQMRKKTFPENKVKFEELLQSSIFYPVKTEILYQIKDVAFADKRQLLLLALQTKEVKVRQAVAEFTDDIPIEFKSDYEGLLDDSSYDTKEIAFMNLWKNFPDDRTRYLARAKDWVGSNDKSLRILFLTFSVKNESEGKQQYWIELLDYTSPKYESPVRQNAIINVLAIDPKNETVLKNLVNATTHHKWQFTKFARDKIRELLLQEGYREIFQSLLPNLNENEKAQLQRLLEEKI